MDDSTNKSTYKNSGVDTGAADLWVAELAALTQGGTPLEGGAQLSQVVSGVGDYASIYALDERQWIAASCDGIGSKLLWALEGLGSPEDLAQDLVAMNVNDLVCVGARPLLFLDYLAVGSKDLFRGEQALLKRFVRGLHQACLRSGALLVGGETAQMPGLYEPTQFEAAGFAIGQLSPEERLGVHRVEPGSEVFGWPSSGPHSNGFTWLRQMFASAADEDFIRSSLMCPTRLYVQELRQLRQVLGQLGHAQALQAAYHITGSGLLNLLRAQPEGRSIGFDLHRWPSQDPEWFHTLRERSGAPNEELWSTFNGGYGMMVVIEPGAAHETSQALGKLGLQGLGRVGEEPTVRLRGCTLS